MSTSNHSGTPESAEDGGEGGETASLRCGDCHSPLQPPWEPAASPARAEEFYCPLCATPVGAPLRCADCGSAICPACGTPVELVDELGIG